MAGDVARPIVSANVAMGCAAASVSISYGVRTRRRVSRMPIACYAEIAAKSRPA